MTEYDKKRLSEIVEALRYADMPVSARELMSIIGRLDDPVMTLKYKGVAIPSGCAFREGVCQNKTSVLWIPNERSSRKDRDPTRSERDRSAPRPPRPFIPSCDECAEQCNGNLYWHIEPLPSWSGNKQEPEPTYQHIRHIEI